MYWSFSKLVSLPVSQSISCQAVDHHQSSALRWPCRVVLSKNILTLIKCVNCLKILHLSEGQFKQLLEEQIQQKRSEEFDDIAHVLDQLDEEILKDTSWKILELVYKAENKKAKRKRQTADKDTDRKPMKRKNIECNSMLTGVRTHDVENAGNDKMCDDERKSSDIDGEDDQNSHINGDENDNDKDDNDDDHDDSNDGVDDDEDGCEPPDDANDNGDDQEESEQPITYGNCQPVLLNLVRISVVSLTTVPISFPGSPLSVLNQ